MRSEPPSRFPVFYAGFAANIKQSKLYCTQLRCPTVDTFAELHKGFGTVVGTGRRRRLGVIGALIRGS